MDIRVAAGAGCQFRRACAHSVHRAGCNGTMALVAQGIDLRHVQEPCVLRTMRRMAPKASLGFDRGVLKDKRPSRFRVTLGADLVLIGCRFQVVIPESAVRIVAIGAI